MRAITRAPRQNSETMVAVTSTASTIAINEYASADFLPRPHPERDQQQLRPRGDHRRQPQNSAAGCRERSFRHESSGPSAVRNSSAKKYRDRHAIEEWWPDRDLGPCTHSEISGNSVPHRIVKHAASSSRLLNRKLDSRETSASSRFSLFRCSRFLTKKNSKRRTSSARKAKNQCR